jgi:hypothetical protein
MVPFFMIINLSGKEKWLPFDNQRGAHLMIKNNGGDLRETIAFVFQIVFGAGVFLFAYLLSRIL